MNSLKIAAASLLPWIVLPLAAQNPPDDSGLVMTGHPAVPGSLPESPKAEGNPVDELPLITSQNAATLEPGARKEVSVDSVIDLGVLGRTAGPVAANAEALERISATYRQSGTPETNCRTAALSVEQRVKLVPSDLLAIVETEVSANSQCVCEIVKSAILASNADTDEVVRIVETAIHAAPETMRLVSQCAIAASPDSLAAIQGLLARLDPNAGEGESAKSSKHAKAAAVVASMNEVAPSPNPLDFPGIGPVGPTSGGPGGQPLIPPMPPIITPPVTVVDP